MSTRFRWILAGSVVVLILVGYGLWGLLYPPVRGSGYEFVTQFGSEYLTKPVGIALLGDRIYVTDTDNNRMVVFDRAGNKVGEGGSVGSNPGQFRRPLRMATGPDGKLYVADALNHRIQVFTPRGNYLRSIGSKGTGFGKFDQPVGVDVDPEGNLYVVEFEGQRVQKLAPAGTPLKQWGHTGDVGYFHYGYFNYPTDVEVAPDGSFFVSDSFNDRVKQYSPDGILQAVWGGFFGLNVPGPFRGWFKGAYGLEVSPDGERLFVSDFGNHRVQVFQPDGTFMSAFGKTGDGPGEMNHPTEVAVHGDGTVYVVDFGNNRIQVWKPKQGTRSP